MAINLAAPVGEPLSEMNTTPLIDVMLVLLIVFIITLPVMTHAVKLDVRGEIGSSVAATPVNIVVEYDGTVLWNGEVVNDLEELEKRFRTVSSSLPAAEVRVSAERRAGYDTVAKVLALAQRSGIQRLGIQGND